MPRPHKCRKVSSRPVSSYFKPRGVPLTVLEEVILSRDEFEAIRLADFKDMYQEEAAKQMNVSRQTFGNIVRGAHKKIADTLLNAKALKIEGGKIEMMERSFTCMDCKNVWSLPYGLTRPNECPTCKGSNVHRSPKDKERKRQGLINGKCRRHRCITN